MEMQSDFPFSTKEPQVYQGDFVVSDSSNEYRRFVARNAAKSRFDIFQDGDLYLSQIKTDRIYSLNHKNKIYSASTHEVNSSLFDGGFGSIGDFFRGKEYREFEDLGIEGTLRKYRVRQDESTKDIVLIYVDEQVGMIIKQEFVKSGENQTVKFVYEIRNLKLEADDTLFTIPEDYREVTLSEYRTQLKHKIK